MRPTIFTAVLLDADTAVPEYVRPFRTLAKAKAFVEEMQLSDNPKKWEEYHPGKSVFGYVDEDDNVMEEIAAVFVSELED